MSTAVFPTLAGQSVKVSRDEVWDGGSEEIRAVSGKETGIAYWANPLHEWTIEYNVLRSETFVGVSYTELQQLAGFFNLRQGSFDSFLFNDTDDNSVTLQGIGTGDGSTKTFQLVRARGGSAEPVLAPNVVSDVRINNVTQSGGSYSVSAWGSAAPGVVTFVSAPGNGLAITASFTYYWPCKFLNARLTLQKFMKGLWSTPGIVLRSLK